MISFTLSILSLIAVSVAQNQTVSLFLPNADPQSLVGSIVGGDATATTYVVECANGGSNALAAITSAAATTALAAAASDLAAAATDLGGDCGFPVPVTLVEGPSTVIYSLAADDSTVKINCDLSGTSVAVCTAAATGPLLTDISIPATTATTLSGTDVSYLPVVITAGAVSNTASTPTSTTASATGSAKGGSTGPAGSGNSNGGTQTQTGSTTGPSTQASGAAMHMGPGMGMGAAGALAAVAAVVL